MLITLETTKMAYVAADEIGLVGAHLLTEVGLGLGWRRLVFTADEIRDLPETASTRLISVHPTGSVR